MKSIQWKMLCAVLALVGCQPKLQPSASSTNETLFTVDNSINVMADEFIYMYEKNNFSNKQANTNEDILSYLDLYKIFKLKIIEAQSLGMDTTDAFKKEFSKYRDQLTENYLSSNKITDSLIREAYDRYTREVKASHILIKVAPHEDTTMAYNKIMNARERIIDGEDFEIVAKEVSEDPSAKTNGGDLGYFTSMQMVYPFETAAYNTAIGELSNPVKTQFGYHIIKVFDRRPSQGKLEVAHIMVRTTPNDDEVKKETATNKIFDIKEQVSNGMDWDMLCRQYSEDNNTKNNGGKLRSFGTGNMPVNFYDASVALETPGDVSDPFTTPYGWHIVKLIRKIEVEPFDKMKGIISNRIKRDERVEIGRNALVTKLKRENGFIEHSYALEQAKSKLDSTNFTAIDTTNLLTLFEIGMDKFTNQQYMEYLSVQKKPVSRKWSEHVTKTYNKFVEESIINYEKAHLSDKYFDYKMLVNEYREGIMLFNLMDEKVWSKATVDTIGLKKYFDDHSTSYKWRERAVVDVYNSGNEDVINEIKELISNVDSIGLTKNNLESRYNQNSTLNLQVENGPFEKGVNPILRKVEWNAGTYEFSEKGRFYLVNIKEILPESAKEFENIKGLVISDYQGYLEKKWVNTLKKKYPIDINEKALNTTIRQLEKK